jgi:hypothetical protein
MPGGIFFALFSLQVPFRPLKRAFRMADSG